MCELIVIPAMKYNGSTYIYRKDVQGNIIALLDSNGRIVVKYAYDAWGNYAAGALDYYDGKVQFKNVNSDKAFNADYEKYKQLANINPFRYRGYYYDTETELYFLKTRYYDPEVGRFISPDSIEYLDPETINGLNLYAYCLNNPIIYSDPYGTWSWSSFWRGLGYIITGVGAIVAGALVMASGVALVPMLIAAGVTIGAGALTTINGAAEIGEAIGGYNYMKDGVFGGNATAYNIYAGITDGIAMIGFIICGAWLKVNAPRIQAYKNIASYEFSGTLSKSDHLARSYQQSTLLQKNIIKFGKMVKETPGRYRFTIDGSFSIGWVSYGIGKSVQHPVMWKIVVDITKQIIYHAGF